LGYTECASQGSHGVMVIFITLAMQQPAQKIVTHFERVQNYCNFQNDNLAASK